MRRPLAEPGPGLAAPPAPRLARSSATSAAAHLARRRWIAWVAPLTLPAVLVAGYSRFLFIGWVGTDSRTLALTSRVTSLDDLWRLLSRPVMDGTTFVEGSRVFRPLPSLTFALDAAIWGDNAIGFHLTSLVLFALSAFLVWRILGRLGASRLAALLGSLVFALHPVAVPAVAVIARRDNLVALASLLGACLALLPPGQIRWPGRQRLGVAAALFGAALLSKEAAFAALPLLAALLVRAHLAVRGRDARSWRALGGALALLAGVEVAAFVLRALVVGGLGGYGDRSVAELDGATYRRLFGYVSWYLLWPFHADRVPSQPIGWAAALLASLLGGSLLALRAGRRPGLLCALGTAWILAFGLLFTGLKTLTGAYLLSFALPGVALWVAGAVDAARAPPAPRDRQRRWEGVAVRVPMVLAAAFMAGVLATSPLVQPYDLLRRAGAIGESFLATTIACVRDARAGDTLVLDRLPVALEPPTLEVDLLLPAILQDHTVTAVLGQAYPGTAPRVGVRSSVTLRDDRALTPPTCRREGDTWVVEGPRER